MGTTSRKTVTSNSQSRSKTLAKVHETSSALQAVHRETLDCDTRKKNRCLLFSDESPGPTPTCTIRGLVADNSCRTACADNSKLDPPSRYRCPSATNHLAGACTPTRRYDVRKACPQARIQKIFRHTSCQVPPISKCTHLPQCRELEDSRPILPNCYHHTPSLQNNANQTILNSTPHSHETPSAARRPACLAQMGKPFAVDHNTIH